MKPNVTRHRNLPTVELRAIRVENCSKTRDHLKNEGGDVIICIDEKKFNVDEVANEQDVRVISCKPSHVPTVMQSKNLASV